MEVCQCARRTDVIPAACRAGTAVSDRWPTQKRGGRTVTSQNRFPLTGSSPATLKYAAPNEQPNPLVQWEKEEESIYFINHKTWSYPDGNPGPGDSLVLTAHTNISLCLSNSVLPIPNSHPQNLVTQMRWCLYTENILKAITHWIPLLWAIFMASMKYGSIWGMNNEYVTKAHHCGTELPAWHWPCRD